MGMESYSPTDVLRLAALLYDASLDDSRWLGALKEIEIAISANNVHLLVIDHEHGVPAFGVVSRHPEANAEYIFDYAQIDERLPRVLSLPHATPTRHDALFRDREISTSAVYNEFLAKYDGQEQSISRMDGLSGRSVVLSAIRSANAGAFSDVDHQLIRQLLPHVVRSVQIRHALYSANGDQGGLTTLLDRPGQNAILLDRFGEIIETTAGADQLLQVSDGIRTEHRFLRAQVPAENDQLQKLIHSAIRQSTGTVAGSGGVVRISRSSAHRPFAVLVFPITGAKLDFGARRPAVGIIIKDTTALATTNTDNLQQAYDLTTTEAGIVLALCDGLSIDQIAIAHGRSKNTIRWTLRNAMQKTGTHTQAGLIRMVLLDFGAVIG